ncbi:hypothetical protein CMV_007022 [Castanea mollissima]|uniref:AN1-type domain-containing protein n=1 Tax=Castanea mollissima TaxID=60419 RepID=A0A8J4RAQ0_9ROSI|nr:hypothetical protein CMV_007022 [Castanea mollissima]
MCVNRELLRKWSTTRQDARHLLKHLSFVPTTVASLEEQAKLAASSVESIVSGNSSSNTKEPAVAAAVAAVELPAGSLESMVISTEASSTSTLNVKGEEKVKEGPNRCNTCRKRVGLTGFNCRCGNLFCAVHRYSDKHECPYDYRAAGQDAIAKANPVVKAEKLDTKI